MERISLKVVVGEQAPNWPVSFRIAMGSASELDYHLLLCRDFEFISNEQYDRTARELVRIRKMLLGLLTSVEAQILGRANAAGA